MAVMHLLIRNKRSLSMKRDWYSDSLLNIQQASSKRESFALLTLLLTDDVQCLRFITKCRDQEHEMATQMLLVLSFLCSLSQQLLWTIHKLQMVTTPLPLKRLWNYSRTFWGIWMPMITSICWTCWPKQYVCTHVLWSYFTAKNTLRRSPPLQNLATKDDWFFKIKVKMTKGFFFLFASLTEFLGMLPTRCFGSAWN